MTLIGLAFFLKIFQVFHQSYGEKRKIAFGIKRLSWSI